MWRLLISTIILSLCAGEVAALASAKQDRRQNGASSTFAATSFDYDYGAQSRRAARPHQKSSPTTTERPIVRYWNNIMRNVRLPIPTITWNMSTPLLNLFNAGGTNAMESPVVPYHPGGTKRRRKNTRRQPNIVVQRTRKRKRPQKHNEEEREPETAAAEDEQQEYNIDFDPNKPLYFYDPTSNQYYEMQRLQSENTYQQESTELPQNQVDNSAAVEDSAGNDASHTKEMKNLYPPDDDVAVVSKLDDEEEDGKITSDRNSENNAESLRNAIGSFMSDDHLNRKRQRANPKLKGSKRIVGLSKPRNRVRYYFLEAV